MQFHAHRLLIPLLLIETARAGEIKIDGTESETAKIRFFASGQEEVVMTAASLKLMQSQIETLQQEVATLKALVPPSPPPHTPAPSPSFPHRRC